MMGMLHTIELHTNIREKRQEEDSLRQAHLHILGNEVRKEKINPYIFGHFVEDIRDHMEAMLAYPLKGMDFEDESAASSGVSAAWLPYTNGKSTEYMLEPAAPKHSGHSQKIRIFSADQCVAGISQRIEVKSDIAYSSKLVARATVEIRQVRLAIVDRSTGELLCETFVEAASHNWREYTADLKPTRRCNNAEFRLEISSEGATWRDSVSTGTLWLDHVSLLPQDAVGNVKKEVVDMTKRLNAGMMRLAGNYISAYHWEHAVGPELERPSMINEAWGGWTSKYFGTDEFLRFCRDVGAEPLICVNAGSGTPEEAADWVRYCNEDASTPFGAMRAANGQVEPYGVKYWEVGNEIWGPWQVGHCEAEPFAHRYLAFAKVMKEADPSIKLMACGHTQPRWNKPLLDIAGEWMDYLTMHIYHGSSQFPLHVDTPKESRYKSIVTFPEYTRLAVNRVREIIESNPRHRHVKLAITEYNTMYYPNTIRWGLPTEHTLEAAVANAGNFNEFIRSSDLVEIGSYSDLVNGWLGGCIRVGDQYADQFRGKVTGASGGNDVVYGTPTYYVMEMYANRDIAHVVEQQLDCGGFELPLAPKGMELDTVSDLDVVSCVNKRQDRLTVFAVNRSLDEVELSIGAEGFPLQAGATVWELTSDDYEAINDVHAPERIVSRTFAAETSKERFTTKLRAHSVYIFEFIRD
jgi:alpha-N-arabinofuranosidase